MELEKSLKPDKYTDKCISINSARVVYIKIICYRRTINYINIAFFITCTHNIILSNMV